MYNNCESGPGLVYISVRFVFNINTMFNVVCVKKILLIDY
jgi:hypothetical protein